MGKPKMEIVSNNLVWIDFKGKEIRLEQDNFYNQGKLMITVHAKDGDYHAKLLVEDDNANYDYTGGDSALSPDDIEGNEYE